MFGVRKEGLPEVCLDARPEEAICVQLDLSPCHGAAQEVEPGKEYVGLPERECVLVRLRVRDGLLDKSVGIGKASQEGPWITHAVPDDREEELREQAPPVCPYSGVLVCVRMVLTATLSPFGRSSFARSSLR